MNLHLVSDSTGETLNSMARATLARFEDQHVVHHRWSLIRSRLQLDRVLEGLRHEPGPVLFTLVDRSLRHALEECCERLGVPCLSVLDQVMELLQSQLGAQPKEKRAAQHVMDADYFRRIDAMHYVLAHDDGQGAAGIAEADVCLVGVSRSSKTPTCFYLANRGIKAANVPIVPRRAAAAGAGRDALPRGRPHHRGRRADRDPPPPPAADRRRRRAPGHHRLHRPGRGEGRDPGGAPALHRARLAGDRRDPPLHRGDGGDGAATDGGLALRQKRGVPPPQPLDPAPTCSAVRRAP